MKRFLGPATIAIFTVFFAVTGVLSTSAQAPTQRSIRPGGGDLGAERIAVQHFTFKQVSYRCQTNMGMRAHIDALIFFKVSRAHMVKKHPGADATTFPGRQGAAHTKAPQIFIFGFEHQL